MRDRTPDEDEKIAGLAVVSAGAWPESGYEPVLENGRVMDLDTGGNLIKIHYIDHVVLRTSRAAAMTAFYCDVLGCTVERTLSAEIGLTQLRAGQALIDLVAVDSQLGKAGGAAPGISGRNLDHLCLQVAPIQQQELVSWLQHHGIPVEPFETRYGASGFGPSVYISDPDGNTIELRIAGTAERG